MERIDQINEELIENEDEIICPYCSSDCIIEYEDISEYEDDGVEHELEYSYTCTACGRHF